MNKPSIFSMFGLLVVGAARIAVLVAIVSPRAQDKPDAVVAYVNKEPVAAEFFTMKLGQNRSAVFSYFANKYQAQADSAFWTKNFSGEVPLAMLKKAALAECAKIKIQEILAKQKGLIQDLSWSGFLLDLERENARRQGAVQHNMVIYGPVRYDTATYYSYRLDNLTRKLKEALLQKELAISDNELKAYFESIRDRYEHSNLVTFHRIFIPYGRDARPAVEGIYGYLENHGGDFDSVARVWNAKHDCMEQTFHSRSYQYYIKHSPELVVQVKKISEGHISGIFESDSGFNIIKCVQKGTKPDFERARPGITLELLDRKYARYIDALVKKAVIKIEKANYDSIR